jgi:hypothetical protein
MTANEILRDLTVRGVILSADGKQLNVDAPDDLLTDETLAVLKEHKAELLKLLAIERCPICAAELAENSGKRFRHLWCPMPGNHFDAWRADGGRKLSETGAPIIRERG